MKTKIVGTGSSAPQNVVTNDDLAKIVDTSDEWIYSRTGIKQRRIATDENAGTLATDAAKRALENAKVDAQDIELIIVATTSPDYTFPNTASVVQSNIGAVGAMCVDISAACTGFIYGLSMAEAYIQSGQFKKALIIGAEYMSSIVNWKDRSTCVLFGDGAGAVVLAAVEDETEGFRAVSCLHSDGSKGHVLTYGDRAKLSKNEQDFLYMDGQEVFKFAVKKVPESITEVLEKADMKLDDVKYFILHQANIRIIEAVAKRLGQEMEKFPTNVANYGNTSAASIPILLDELNRNNILKRGDKIILSGFGAGLSWGSTLLEW
ncbi:MAG: ketoacyl-ACP synthase III [Lachnospira sp.]|nr:ketoacyl-ACP synthase III [Lachnospira sp.]